jgi:hypothetical protein
VPPCNPPLPPQAAFVERPEADSYIVQLGDLGTGPTSGSDSAFAAARAYLDLFATPYNLITGNHDLEGRQFASDEENLAAWRAAFGQSHYWARDVGPCVVVGLSTTRHRSNVLSHHEARCPDRQSCRLSVVPTVYSLKHTCDAA